MDEKDNDTKHEGPPPDEVNGQPDQREGTSIDGRADGETTVSAASSDGRSRIVARRNDGGSNRKTKAELIRLGEEYALVKEKRRVEAKERAERKKSEGMLTVTLRTHKDHRSPIIALGKMLIKLFEHMKEANMDTAPVSEQVQTMLRDYHETHVKPNLRKGKQ